MPPMRAAKKYVSSTHPLPGRADGQHAPTKCSMLGAQDNKSRASIHSIIRPRTQPLSPDWLADSAAKIDERPILPPPPHGCGQWTFHPGAKPAPPRRQCARERKPRSIQLATVRTQWVPNHYSRLHGRKHAATLKPCQPPPSTFSSPCPCPPERTPRWRLLLRARRSYPWRCPSRQR